MTIREMFCVKPASLAFPCTTLLAGIGLVALHSQPMMAKPSTPLQVADELDRIIQPRFVQNAGMFGLSRLVPVINGHAIGFIGLFNTQTPAETSLLSQADSANRDYVIAFLHCAHVPGHFVRPGVFQPDAGDGKLTETPPRLTTLVMTRNPSPGASSTPPQEALGQSLINGDDKDQFEKTAIQNLPRLRKGKDAQTTVGQWTLVMRPVRASADTCVNCHTGSKKGDTLGVMVYAVGNTVNTPPPDAQQTGIR